MKKVIVYKLGIDMYYENNQANDKNGGLYEYNLIKNKVMHLVKKYSMSIANDTVFFVNGSSSSAEQKMLIDTYKNYVKVFIATDFFAFEKNKEMIEACDIVLHQSMNGNIPIPKDKPNAFSFVPYLFFKYPSPRCVGSQNGRVIFGGANTGRDNKFNEYIVKDSDYKQIEAFTKIYNQDGTVKSDTRIPYDKFIKEMRDYSYALMITRMEYTLSRWFTPRFVEAVSNWVLPLVDIDYPVPYDMLIDDRMIVLRYEDISRARAAFNKPNSGSDSILSYLTNYIASNTAKFEWLAYQILLGCKINDIYIYKE